MGLYIELPLGGRIQTKLDWLVQHGEEIGASGDDNTIALSFTQAKTDNKRYCFWNKAPWGDNVALAFDPPELLRLFSSGAFERLFLVPVEDLKAAGVRVP